MDIEGYAKNPSNSCYYCKRELLTKINNIAEENGINQFVDGSNLNDTEDLRPGNAGVISPLKMVGMTKNDIRQIPKEFGLEIGNKSCLACLYSRVHYGSEITIKKLEMIEEAE